jgi:hypothetical protein
MREGVEEWEFEAEVDEDAREDGEESGGEEEDGGRDGKVTGGEGEGGEDEGVGEVEGVGGVTEEQEEAWVGDEGFEGQGGEDDESSGDPPEEDAGGGPDGGVGVLQGQGKGNGEDKGRQPGREALDVGKGGTEAEAEEELELNGIEEPGPGTPGVRQGEADEGDGGKGHSEGADERETEGERQGEEEVKGELVVEGPAYRQDGKRGAGRTEGREEEIGGQDVGPARPEVKHGGWEREEEGELERGGEPIERGDAQEASPGEGLPGGAEAGGGEEHDQAADRKEKVDSKGSVPEGAREVWEGGGFRCVVEDDEKGGEAAEDLNAAEVGFGRLDRRTHQPGGVPGECVPAVMDRIGEDVIRRAPAGRRWRSRPW